MSRENFIRAAYEVWRREDLDAFLAALDPEIEFRTSGAFPDIEPIYRGHDGMRRFWDAMRTPWEWFHLDVDRIVEAEDRAAIVVRFRARGRGSGVMTNLEQGHALWFKDGLIIKVSAHRSFEQALKAAGLSEQGSRTTAS